MSREDDENKIEEAQYHSAGLHHNVQHGGHSKGPMSSRSRLRSAAPYYEKNTEKMAAKDTTSSIASPLLDVEKWRPI